VSLLFYETLFCDPDELPKEAMLKSLGISKLGEIPIKSYPSSRNHKQWSRIINKLQFIEYQEFGSEILIMAHSFARKVLGRLKVSLVGGDIFKIFAVCFFLAFKFIRDDEHLFVKDIVNLTGMTTEKVEELETVFFVDILKFKLHLSDSELNSEKILMRQIASKNRELFYQTS